MHINQDNYEQYFLDHAEGNLSPEMERELMDFLEANPDLKSVLNDFDPSPIQTVEIRNELLKAGLKKHLHLTDHIREDNVDEWMIRELEGLLDETEICELKEFLSLNPAYNFDHKLFSQTKLTPDLSIVYRQKDELKKKGVFLPVIRLAWLLPAAAAVILLFIGVRFLQKTEVDIAKPVNLPEHVSVADIPESNAPDIETPSAETVETPSHETPSQISRPGSFRLKPSVAKAVIFQDPAEISEINLTAYSISPIMTAENKQKPFIAKVFSNIIAKARDGFNNRTNLDKIGNPDFSFWSIAKAGIDGYNSLSDREIELYVRKDENGKVKSYALIDQDQLLLSKGRNKE